MLSTQYNLDRGWMSDKDVQAQLGHSEGVQKAFDVDTVSNLARSSSSFGQERPCKL